MIFALETHRLLFPTGITVASLKEAVGLLILYSKRPFFQEAFVWIFDSSEFRRIGRDFGEYSIESNVQKNLGIFGKSWFSGQQRN